MSSNRWIWKYRDRSFETKLERDMYQRGFEDGLKECQKGRSGLEWEHGEGH